MWESGGDGVEFLFWPRSRIGVGVEFTQSPPVNETTENYEMDIKNDAGDIVRTIAYTDSLITSSNKIVLPYTDDQMSEDGISSLASRLDGAIVNGGAEVGDTSSWVDGVAGFLALITPAPKAGTYIFGASTTVSAAMYQEFDLVALGLSAADIDAGLVWVDAIAFMQTDAVDEGRIKVQYRDGVPADISTTTPAFSKSDGVWGRLQIEEAMPANTRFVRIHIEQNNVSASTTQTFFDQARITFGYAGAVVIDVELYQMGDDLGRGIVRSTQVNLGPRTT